jgi:lysophospholipase L1-like esterase
MLRIKTGPRRGGFVENIYMNNCRGKRMIRVFNIFTKYCAQWGAFPDFELRRTRIRNINISDCEAELASYGIELNGDERLPPSGIRIRNIKIGRVIQAFTEVRNCYDVDITGLSLAPEGTVSFSGKEFIAQGESAEKFAADGSWKKLVRQVKPGDRVVLRFPPSAARDRFAAHASGQGGVVSVEPWGPKLFFAGDSTLDDKGQSFGGDGRYPYASWGTTLQRFMREGCAVANYARGGASTKSFRNAGIWEKLISKVNPGDFVAIAFGHNDQKRSKKTDKENRWADPKGLFREIVREWVKDVRAKGATPILMSPICRGTFDSKGEKLIDITHKSDGVCLGSYRDAMKELSEELKCDYVDMNGLTRELMERVGKEEAMKYFVISTGYRKSMDGEPSKDTTHPCRAGAEAFAKLFLDDVKSRKLSVAELFRGDK